MPASNTSGDILMRLEHLESQQAHMARSIGRYRKALSLLGLATFVTVVCGAVMPMRSIDTDQVNIIGKNGKPRIILGTTGDDSATIELFDAGGDSHVRLFVDHHGGRSALMMRDIKDDVRIDLGIDPLRNIGGMAVNGQPKL